MKTFLPTLALCSALICTLAAQTPEPPAPDTQPSENDIYPRWSVLGEWKVTHPSWTDVVTFRDDGTMRTKTQETTGRWVLSSDTGTPLLVLRWDAYGTESLLMVGPQHFRGQIQPGSFMDMRRGDEKQASETRKKKRERKLKVS